MVLTEKEASQKACPMPDFINCNGSACMAWRWAWDSELGDWARRMGQRAGYCGLAGRPTV